MSDVVMLNYNGGSEILRCLRSLRGVAEIVVVDNASTDGSDHAIERDFPEVRVIRNRTNRGFAAAANQGIRATTGEFVFLVNPDATVRADAFASLTKMLRDHPRAGAVGALVLNEDGSVQPTKRVFPTLWQSFLHSTVGTVWPNNPGTRAYVMADETFDAPRPVDWVAMTAVMLRRSAFEEIGGFDERFFFFVEDVDLCKRLRDAKWEIWFDPGAEVTHLWGGSWTKKPLKYMAMHHTNLFRYVRKHKRGLWVLAYPFIALGLLARFMLLALRWLFTRRAVPAHKDVS